MHKNHNNYCIAYIFIVWTGASNYNLKSFESKQMSLNKMNQWMSEWIMNEYKKADAHAHTQKEVWSEMQGLNGADDDQHD